MKTFKQIVNERIELDKAEKLHKRRYGAKNRVSRTGGGAAKKQADTEIADYLHRVPMRNY